MSQATKIVVGTVAVSAAVSFVLVAYYTLLV
ncbi:adenosine deaminase [Halalkalicoccus sp. NIPERK01]|nr:adenosine deaminase [Halalkalicoccus sp. NIPERK01]MDL5362913.1 adenosine deaminase [Halalkalicoccus sp. NIPERK01]